MRYVDTKELKKIMVDADCNTIGELAERAGINRVTLGCVLNGEQTPSYETISRLAEALEMSPEAVGRVFYALKLT